MTKVVWAAVLLGVVVLVAGCGSSSGGRQANPDPQEEILREYQARFESVRAKLAGFAGIVPQSGVDKAVCDRPLEPEFTGFPYKDPVRGTPGDNAELMLAENLTNPERGLTTAELKAPQDTDTFAVVPGYLARGLGLTGARGPLGSKEIPEGITNSGRTDLDAGLRVRYLIALRVVQFEPPKLIPIPPEIGVGHSARGGVTVDAFVIDMDRGDVPCRLRATGSVGPHTDLYADIQTSVALDTLFALRKIS